ncbi:hypothetical protein IMSAG049_00197 [Clostridiales bacterium]|nr:hypothetical protein IMSAG049_00197 [Clostridiales bacterium]
MKQLQTKKRNTVNNSELKNVFFRAVIMLCAMGMSLTGCNNNNSSKAQISNEVDSKDEDDNKKPPQTVIDNPKTESPETNERPDDKNIDQSSEVITEEKNPVQNNTVSSKPVKDSALSLSWSKLESTAKAGQSYYSEYYTKTRVVTQNGYLYNYAANTQITSDYLVNEGMLSLGATASGINIMLVYGSDIAQYGSNIYMNGTDREFTVFAFMKHPSENKYIFSSANGSYGTLSESSYNSLMAKYSMDHGTIRRLTPSNSEYDRILSCIKMYESRYEQYFVRSITVDDKYAFVVLSGRANAATIREYILRYDNGIWEVVMDDLETEGRLPVTVNKTLPDFNMSLLPTYSIKDYTMLTDYSAVIEALTKAGLYVKDDTFYYFCGTNEFCYMISDSGKRFLCRFNGQIWECYKVLDYYDALSRLQNFSNNPPTFILLDLE